MDKIRPFTMWQRVVTWLKQKKTKKQIRKFVIRTLFFCLRVWLNSN